LGRRQRFRDGNDPTLARYAHGFGESLESVASALRRVVAAPYNWAFGAKPAQDSLLTPMPPPISRATRRREPKDSEKLYGGAASDKSLE
jgi:hypothetical protein